MLCHLCFLWRLSSLSQTCMVCHAVPFVFFVAHVLLLCIVLILLLLLGAGPRSLYIRVLVIGVQVEGQAHGARSLLRAPGLMCSPHSAT